MVFFKSLNWIQTATNDLKLYQTITTTTEGKNYFKSLLSTELWLGDIYSNDKDCKEILNIT